ncbi:MULTISPECIES: bifunctional 2-polyprenyl-6-hydroxyphenol methylase/3-demethylubiquinol 3-O-methyltransferase UbiG [Idiomarina]|jgi:2-polyprenyl-6-hydroxyphenyl methylase/3-demethylubiquinone-9 3-methyltransferase|uniref:Ubiquinone biosynthesis O-methyltransferase n=1 Tax=Idiomarina abyssalis TaxID=86102 RepID=A0A8I1KFI9_9GAMM|nr:MULTISPECIES: bifunctional 2-polyprenyl-6-hydroxyphenol methylase/3-demethylubiquinol 3-O-methyltransferase UbiG [Idiomarina]MAO67275.1 bifunctional 3-demethylubiquinol 3-O-methyltransferase/2-polyprenyl-6-hydroxyphenol methylase [Idiomarina sp.]MBF80073.1 bifunctional 3-demethylubiquinol 3-O-methyltransferase/2-polyprenyl-6-hydroxyphenol methylase [Idiomarina sp.]MBJ7267944.1 bifunctional 2-polyprenyl-6-hydroxyphenol methylase/3-demethylubiquinol 3-O-methyltransferase UbiG [Idiomarina abyssa|tara:strand:+ start:41009 stop:41737 length:729 start_codon:yes stop_codon:yes gene_type:complete
MTTSRSKTEQKNVDPEEIAKFSALASRWWDPDGEFKPLHKINPVRLGFIENHTEGLFGKKVLDVGCGGGLLSEAMAERGAEVTGIDLAEQSLKVARLHALESGRQIDYQCIAVETLAEQNTDSYDVVTCLEMLEHVPDPAAIVQACAKAVKPGGLVFFSTLNRNVKSWLLGIVAAEHILGWVPKGTHQHQRFIRPSELLSMTDKAALEDIAINGLIFHPLKGFVLSDKDVDVNYIVALKKPE